jgi:hypothetical protein
VSTTLGDELFSIQAVGTCWNHSNVVTPVVSINNTFNSTTPFDVLNIQQHATPHKTTLAVYVAIIMWRQVALFSSTYIIRLQNTPTAELFTFAYSLNG